MAPTLQHFKLNEVTLHEALNVCMLDAESELHHKTATMDYCNNARLSFSFTIGQAVKCKCTF